MVDWSTEAEEDGTGAGMAWRTGSCSIGKIGLAPHSGPNQLIWLQQAKS